VQLITQRREETGVRKTCKSKKCSKLNKKRDPLCPKKTARRGMAWSRTRQTKRGRRRGFHEKPVQKMEGKVLQTTGDRQRKEKKGRFTTPHSGTNLGVIGCLGKGKKRVTERAKTSLTEKKKKTRRRKDSHFTDKERKKRGTITKGRGKGTGAKKCMYGAIKQSSTGVLDDSLGGGKTRKCHGIKVGLVITGGMRGQKLEREGNVHKGEAVFKGRRLRFRIGMGKEVLHGKKI